MLTAYSSGRDTDVKIVAAWKLPFFIAYNKLWNLARRPFVNQWKRDIVSISAELKELLSLEVLPVLYDNMRCGCSECMFLYSFLRGQPFTSQIEQALLKGHCSRHPETYLSFYVKYEHLFIRSHSLSDAVCGFKSGRK